MLRKKVEIKELEDGVIEVKINDKVFKLKEVPFMKFKMALKSVMRKDGSVDSAEFLTKLISISLVEPKLSDMEVDNLDSSINMVLLDVVSHMYNLKGVDNFLEKLRETS